jgi:hypothetical protein
MTTIATDPPLTTSAFLFGERADSGQALAQTLQEKGVMGTLGTALQRLSEAGRHAVDQQVATDANRLLKHDLGELVVAGWRKQSALADARSSTLANPGSSKIVELATHRITSVHRPSVEVLMNNVPVTTLNFELQVEFVIKALSATVRDGHIVSLHSGVCDVTAELTAEGAQLAQRKGHFDMAMLVRWPLSLHPGDTDSPAGSAVSPPASSPPRRRNPVIHHSVRRRHNRRLTQRSWPAD